MNVTSAGTIIAIGATATLVHTAGAVTLVVGTVFNGSPGDLDVVVKISGATLSTQTIAAQGNLPLQIGLPAAGTLTFECASAGCAWNGVAQERGSTSGLH